jgi:hypothetical protein
VLELVMNFIIDDSGYALSTPSGYIPGIAKQMVLQVVRRHRAGCFARNGGCVY